MEFKNAYTSNGGLPFEKILKDDKEYVRYINSDKLYECSHIRVDKEYSIDPLLALGLYIQRNTKNYSNIIIDLGGNIALSNITRFEFKKKEKEIYTKVYNNNKDNYESYRLAIEKFRGENLFYIVTPKLESFYQNEPLLMIPEVKDLIQSFHWHIGEITTETIIDILLGWKSIQKSLNQFSNPELLK